MCSMQSYSFFLFCFLSFINKYRWVLILANSRFYQENQRQQQRHRWSFFGGLLIQTFCTLIQTENQMMSAFRPPNEILFQGCPCCLSSAFSIQFWSIELVSFLWYRFLPCIAWPPGLAECCLSRTWMPHHRLGRMYTLHTICGLKSAYSCTTRQG